MIFYASQIFTTSGGNSNNWFSATIKLEILYIIIDFPFVLFYLSNNQPFYNVLIIQVSIFSQKAVDQIYFEFSAYMFFYEYIEAINTHQ